MARYRKVDPRIWNDAKFRKLNDQGKLTFFFLLTHPHMTAIGAMRASLPGLASEIGWSEKAFREAFGDASQKGMALHEEGASLVWLPNFIRYNPPESPNVVKAWVNALELLPECSLLNRVIAESVAFASTLNKGFAEALPEAFTKAMPIQEQEQEQEQEEKQDAGKPARFDPLKIVLPDCIPSESWSEWIGYRRQRKLTCTEQTISGQVSNLQNWHAAGHSVSGIIKTSIASGWQGLFEPKTGGAGSGKPGLSKAGQSTAAAAARWLESEGVQA